MKREDMKKIDIKQLHYNGETVFVFVNKLMIAMLCAKYSNGRYISGDMSNDYAEINNDRVNDTLFGFAIAALNVLPVDVYFKACAVTAIRRYFIKEDKLTAIEKYAIEYMQKENEFQTSIGNMPIY